MIDLSNAIANLLHDHDTVIVPGLGAFIRQEKGAKVNVITNEFEKPSAILSFDPQRREENGLLAEYLSLQSAISEEEALQQIASFVSETFARLQQGASVELPQLGTLSLDSQQNLRFKAVDDCDFNGDAFGLSDMHPKSIYSATKQVDWKEEVAQQIKDKNTPMTVDRQAVHNHDDRLRRWLLWLILILVLCALCAGGWWFYNTKKTPVKPIQPPQNPIEVPKDTLKPVADSLELADDTLALVLDTLQPVVDTVVHPQKVVEPVAPVKPKAFIVGGCFSIQENAETQMDILKGEGYTEAFIMPRGQKYFVCYGQYTTVEEAQSALPKIKAESNNKAWILTK